MMKSLQIFMIIVIPFIYLAGNAFGMDYCVSDETGFYEALALADSNGLDDTIKVEQGTYMGNFKYHPYSGETNSITILGGYTSGCGGRVLDPANTILDGGETDERVLEIYTPFTGASMYVEGFTIRNGNCEFSGGGIYAYTSTDSTTGGTITIKHNIISENTAAYSGGIFANNNTITGTTGTIVISDNIVINNTAASSSVGGIYANANATDAGNAGDVILVNNIVSGNTVSSGNSGGVFAEASSWSGTPGTVTITNNTITGNTASSNGGGLSFLRVGTVNCYNNIVTGNTASLGSDISIIGTPASGTANGFNNNYSGIFNSWNNEGGNIDADPLFVNESAGNYSLRPKSLCIDAGDNAAPQIPGSDIEGNDRIIDGNHDGIADVDMGAVEYVPRSGLMHFLLLFSD